MVVERDGAQWVATQYYTQQDTPPVLCIGIGNSYSEASRNCVEAVVDRVLGVTQARANNCGN